MSTALSTINSLVNDRRRDTTNLSVDMTAEGFRAINGTLQTWNQEHDWPWQIESTTFNYNNGITTYQIPSSWNYKAIVDMRPYKPFQKNVELYYLSQGKFDSDSIHTNKFAVRVDGQTSYLRCQYTGFYNTLNTISSTTSNGTWVGATAISAVANDSYNYYDQSSAVSFSYSGTTGTLTNSTMTSTDLSRYVARSHFYVNFNMQSITNFTGITLKIGSDASNYITLSATTDYLGNTTVVGWNKFGFAWTGTTSVVGTPVYTAITYAQITITYSGNPSTTMNDLENLFVAEDVPMTVEYYSNNMTLLASDGTTKNQIFQNSSNTTDTALWSGNWDWVNEPFTNSVMEIVSYLTGEQADEAVVRVNVKEHLEPLKRRLPSRRRYPQYQITPDINGTYYGPRPLPYRQWGQYPSV